jgi:pimeloyl-ACP methyl ester carboxylesterase
MKDGLNTMNFGEALLTGVMVLVFGATALAQGARPGKNELSVRNQRQEIYFYTPAPGGLHRKVLFAPGDGGWRGFVITVAESLASSGYEVYGLDTRHYLQSFTGPAELKPGEIAADFREIAGWIRQSSTQRVLLVGWSEGAGLALAAASDPQNKDLFEGLIAIGATEQNVLAWHWSDVVAELRKKLPNEPTFASADYTGKVAPLPLFMIASSGDEYISSEATRKLFSAARDPKRMVLIEARDHKYGGATSEFFRTLMEALQWVLQHHQ